jgi:hypothetical protein
MGLFGRRKKKDLVFEGIGGRATIRSAERDERIHNADSTSDDPTFADLGIGTRKYRLELDVQLDDGRPVYTASGRFKIPLDAGELDTGISFPVRADPDDPSNVELDWDAWRASPEQAEIRDGFDAEERAQVHTAYPTDARKQMLDGWVKAVERGAMSREDFDEALGGQVGSGVLTEEEAAAARAAADNAG